MIKAKLIKSLMLGLSMSALTTGVAFGQMPASTMPASAGVEQSAELDALYAKQSEIDQYLFVDHAKEIEEKGIFINYTGVVGDQIEIGISPYSEENANYLYKIFGKDTIQVVEFDQSVIYATTVVDEPAAIDKEDMNTTVSSPDSTVSDADTPEDKVYKDGDVQIQIESIEEDSAEDVVEDAILYTTGDNSDQEARSVKTVSAAEGTDMNVVKNSEDGNDGISAPMMILAIAGGAALVGGAVVLSGKKKTVK